VRNFLAAAALVQQSALTGRLARRLGGTVAEQWFFDEELTRLRWEWVGLIREYGRSRLPAALARAHEAHRRYVERADLLRARGRGLTK
jgi:hypothetical protein